MRSPILPPLFPIAGVLLSQSVQAQTATSTPILVNPPPTTTKRQKLWLIAASTLASAFLGVSEPALAQTFMPPENSPGSGTYTVPAGNYPQGISVNNFQTPIVVTLEPGVIVDNSTLGTSVPLAVNLQTTTVADTGRPATLFATNVTINTISSPSSTLTTGLSIHTAAGDATITASGTINLTGGPSTNAVWAGVFSTTAATASVNWDGTINAKGGSNSTVIQASGNGGAGFASSADCNAIINATGNLTGVFGNSGFGLDAVAGGNGTATVNYNGGAINLTGGSFSSGIFASGEDGATIITLAGTAVTVNLTSTGSAGIEAFSGSGATLAKVASTILVTGPTNPPASDLRFQPTGIRLQSNSGGSAEVDYTGPGITVHGGGGQGISALSRSGSVTVNASGPIVADGSDAVGILADSGTLRNAISGGLPPAPITGPVQVTANNVSTPGEFGTAISANGGSGGVTVNIPSGGSIMGGWQAIRFTPPATPLLPGRPPASVTPLGNISSISGLPAAGIFLSANGGGTATLINNGSIGALSDLAIAGDPQVTNNGMITGFVQFAGGNNSILNNGTFNLRDFAQTTASGGRDTMGVAIADLGTGPGNTFNNSGTGTLALVRVIGAKTLNSMGQYLPLGQASNSMALGGPLQGQIIGVATFTNSGTIDLQANPVPGDVLMITGGRGGSTPGTGGGGTFISNGGTLLLDTVLNEGGAATRSDTLVVDGTRVGANGATSIAIRNAGGTGALTVGDGILVVQVLDPARSAGGAFVLANEELRAGDFDYRLFHGGIGVSNPGDWFLRNEFVVPEPGVPVVPPGGDSSPPPSVVPPPDTTLPPDPPPTPLPPGIYPIIGPEIATYGVVQPLARQLGLAILGTLNDRVGDTYEPDGGAVTPVAATTPSGISKEGGKEVVTPPPPVAAAPYPLAFASSVWSRFFAQGIDNHYRAFADPRASGALWGFQSGVDLLRGSLIAGHYERAGLYGGFGNVNSDVNGLVTNPAATAYSLSRTGSMSLNAWSAGGYWTHVGPGGWYPGWWYLDAVVQGTWYNGSASTQFASLDTDGTGFIVSLEGGAPFRWPQLGPGFVIEPQGQILWQKVSFQDKNDGLGEVALGDTTGPSGRIGLRTKWTIATAGGQVWQPYLRANLWRNWGADAHTVYSGTDVAPLESQATLLELGGGLTIRFNANVSFFANVDYEFAVGATDGNRQNGVRGAFGARCTW